MNRSLMAVAMATIALTSASFAQNAQTNAAAVRPQAARQAMMPINKLAQYLGLSDDQIAKVKAITKQDAPALLKIRTETQKKIKAILTPDQIKKYDEIMAERKAEAAKNNKKQNAAAAAQQPAARKQNRAATQKPDQVRMLNKELALSPAQLDLIKPILQNQAKQLKAIRDDSQKKIKAILTADQLDKYNKLIAAQAAGAKTNAQKVNHAKGAKKNQRNSGF